MHEGFNLYAIVFVQVSFVQFSTSFKLFCAWHWITNFMIENQLGIASKKV